MTQNFSDSEYIPISEPQHKDYRKWLADQLVIAIALEDAPEILELFFDGYGDSGQIHFTHKDQIVETLMHDYFNTYVTFDYYNNDGGGGSVNWDVVQNIIQIEGYTNYTEIETVMNEEY